MKIKVYDPKDHEYHEIANTRDFRITLGNGDAFDVFDNSAGLRIKTVNPSLDISILPMQTNCIDILIIDK
jgi:hypothetical protein